MPSVRHATRARAGPEWRRRCSTRDYSRLYAPADPGLRRPTPVSNPADPFGHNPFSAEPFSAEPFSAEPFSAEPFGAEPFSAEPFSAEAVSYAPLAPAPYDGPPPEPLDYPEPPAPPVNAFATLSVVFAFVFAP